MQVNGINSAKSNVQAFGMKIDGMVPSKLSKELFSRNLGKYSQDYALHYEKLKAAGHPSSELYLTKSANDVTTFVLKNPEITTAYEISLGSAKQGKLLEAWFKIKPEDIKKSEKSLKNLITEKIDWLFAAASKNKELKDTVISAGKDKNLSKAINNLSHEKIIDLYFASKARKL